MKKISFHLILLLCIVTACKKDNPKSKSSSKNITSFVFKSSKNPGILSTDVNSIITNDTIKLAFQQGINLQHLRPDISHSGVGIAPANNTEQDFTKTVLYTVTAEDGSTKTYKVICSFLSNEKTITSFVFKAADNATVLQTDLTGVIGNDTIRVISPAGGVSNLIPTITHTGVSIIPGDKIAQDFTNNIDYTVTAEDGTTKKYTVIVSANLSLYIGNSDGYLYNIDAATGAVKWKYAASTIIYSSPTVRDGVVFFGGDNGSIYAVDAISGNLKWETLTKSSIVSSPTVSNGVVYITNKSELFAVNAVSGAVIWKVQVGAGPIVSSPTVADGLVYTTDFGYGVIAYDKLTGIKQWDYNVGIVRGNPAVVNGTLYTGGEAYKLVAVDAKTGTQKWFYYEGQFGSPGSPTVYKSSVYINGYDGYFYCIDSAAGTLKWKSSESSKGGFSNAIVVNDILYAGNNNFYALDAGTGEIKWKYIINQAVGDPVFANGVVFVRTNDGYLYAFDATKGSVKWKYLLNSTSNSAPCIIDATGKVYHPGISGDQQ